MRPGKLAILIVVFAVAMMTGCTKPITRLESGMSMQDAVSEMHNRGIVARQMAYATLHNAFDLPDGRTVVLIGGKMVDEIRIIANPEEPKLNRRSVTVATFEF